MAEWLLQRIANPSGVKARVGSNPTPPAKAIIGEMRMNPLTSFGKYRVIVRFREKRGPVPSYAEQFMKSSFERTIRHASKFLLGKVYVETKFFCPSCDGHIPIDHGDRILCACGLYMENYGNSLEVWKD